MRKIIKGKLYDTETATKVAEHENMSDVRNFHYFCETLYRKRTGEYFLHGEGGAMSPYGRSCGQNEWCGGESIRPLTYDQARDWTEGFADPDVYESEFGIPDEDAEHDLHVIISEAAWQALSRAATRDGVTVRIVIERLADEL